MGWRWGELLKKFKSLGYLTKFAPDDSGGRHLSLLVCFHWQYVSSYITLIKPDSVRFSRKDGILDAIPMFDPFDLFGLNWPSGVPRCRISCWLWYCSIFRYFPERVLSQNQRHMFTNVPLIWSYLILISIMCSPEKTCGAPQDLCFSADPPSA